MLIARVFLAWLLQCSYSTHGYSMHGYSMHGYSMRGTQQITRDVNVPRHEKMWSTQTRDGNICRFLVAPRVDTQVIMKL